MEGNRLLMLNPRPNSYLSLLDEKTILKICGQLSYLDLLHFSELDVNYRRLIGEKIITKRGISFWRFKEHYDVRKAFKQFGEFARKLNINESDIQYRDEEYTCIEEIFRLIKQYCVDGQLKTVTIGFDVNSEKLEAKNFLDVFADLDSLTIFIPMKQNKFTRDVSLRKMLKKMLANCTKLQKLHLFGMKSDSDKFTNFLMIPQMQNLKSLTFERCEIRHKSWLKFIKAGVRPLKSLKFENSPFTSEVRYWGKYMDGPDQREFIQQIVQAFPNLETFSSDQVHWTTPNPGCDALKQLEHLKEVHLFEPKYSNLVQSLPNSVQKLTLKLHFAIESPPLSITNLTNLQSIEFIEAETQNVIIYKWFLKLPNLTQFAFADNRAYYFYSNEKELKYLALEIIKASDRLKVFKLSIKNPYRLKLNLDDYKKFVQERSIRFPNAEPLHLCAKFHKIKNEQTDPKVIQVCNSLDCKFLS